MEINDNNIDIKFELEEEKDKNKKLEEKINEMNQQLKQYKEYKDKYENEKKLHESLIKKILEKDNENKELRLKLSRYPFELNEGEKLMCINFESDDQKLKNYSIISKNTDKFNIIENKLYKDNPEFYGKENCFVINGNKIHKNKSLEENNIHNNDVIMLNKYN